MTARTRTRRLSQPSPVKNIGGGLPYTQYGATPLQTLKERSKMAKQNELNEPNASPVNAVCGYPNRHWTGAEEMTCTLAPGHAGNHQAPYMRMQLDGKAADGAMASWGEDAGLPVETIEAVVQESAAAERPAPPSIVRRLSAQDRAKLK